MKLELQYQPHLKILLTTENRINMLQRVVATNTKQVITQLSGKTQLVYAKVQMPA